MTERRRWLGGTPGAGSGRVTAAAAASVAVLGALMGGCAGTAEDGGPSGSDPAAGSPAAAPVEAPPPPQPAVDGPCPYLDTIAVQDANGQHVGSVRISADQPHPACFFYRGDGREQVRSWVVVATPKVAGATVDAAAPVATSDLAELPGGWSGGSQPTADGAVFAVARGDTAVVVTTNQEQTISARQIAEQVVAGLGR